MRRSPPIQTNGCVLWRLSEAGAYWTCLPDGARPYNNNEKPMIKKFIDNLISKATGSGGRKPKFGKRVISRCKTHGIDPNLLADERA